MDGKNDDSINRPMFSKWAVMQGRELFWGRVGDATDGRGTLGAFRIQGLALAEAAGRQATVRASRRPGTAEFQRSRYPILSCELAGGLCWCADDVQACCFRGW